MPNEILSPESPGEDRYFESRGRVKSSSSSRSERRRESRGSSGRSRGDRLRDSAKRKSPELVEVESEAEEAYSSSHSDGRAGGATKRPKKGS